MVSNFSARNWINDGDDDDDDDDHDDVCIYKS